MYPQPAGLAVRDTLGAMADYQGRLPQADAALLQNRICAAVDELKAMGWPVERILVRLKEVAAEVGFQPSRSRVLSAVEAERRKVIWAAAITQCIEYYYAQAEPDER